MSAPRSGVVLTVTVTHRRQKNRNFCIGKPPNWLYFLFFEPFLFNPFWFNFLVLKESPAVGWFGDLDALIRTLGWKVDR